jgi:hypothetical protein
MGITETQQAKYGLTQLQKFAARSLYRCSISLILISTPEH